MVAVLTKNIAQHLGVVVEFETPTPGGAIDGFGPKERVVFAQRETGTAPFNGEKPPKRGPKPAGVHFDYTALPLRCGLASTIHSAQGLTLRFGVIIGDLFGHNAALGARRRAVTRQALYVALSRARSLENVYLLGKLSMADIHRCKPNPNDLKYVAKIHDAARKTAQVFQLVE